MLREGFSGKPNAPFRKRLTALTAEVRIAGFREICFFAYLGVASAEPAISETGTAALLANVRAGLGGVSLIVFQRGAPKPWGQ
ncbi:MAG TPA: hypothetical protein DCG21_04075 [Gammaproteobacteria bacterium]|nr:hypothetical protein [Acidiferrobacteraceae bacterium]HAF74398.1 hypothetical protein [Gammaproteobacteria bacterium]